MKCPHCTVAIQPNWNRDRIDPPSSNDIDLEEFLDSQHPLRVETAWTWSAADCPACRKIIIKIELIDVAEPAYPLRQFPAYPPFPNCRNVDDTVPKSLGEDYTEACKVLDISPKASAALSRRVLQGILTDQGYKSKVLGQQIDSVLAEKEPTKVLPGPIRETVDAVRKFGNFAAHPTTEVITLQIIDVEPEEAEWCLEIIEALFDHYYVTPARAHERLDQLNQKLAQPGEKPPKS